MIHIILQCCLLVTVCKLIHLSVYHISGFNELSNSFQWVLNYRLSAILFISSCLISWLLLIWLLSPGSAFQLHPYSTTLSYSVRNCTTKNYQTTFDSGCEKVPHSTRHLIFPYIPVHRCTTDISGTSESFTDHLTQGIPQGSVLGPLLCMLHMVTLFPLMGTPLLYRWPLLFYT